jgi:imidazolonepropionase-like amidohydrolase
MKWIRTMPILALVALFASLAGSQAQAQDKVVAVRASKVYLGGGKVIENGMVLLQNGKIIAVGPRADVKVPVGAERRRAFAVTPGLIDAASNNALGGSRTPQDSEIVPQHRVINSLDLRSKLMSQLATEGVTTVFATSSNEAVIGPQGATVKTGDGKREERLLDPAGAPRMVLVSGPQFGNSSPSSPRNVTPFTRAPLGKMGIVLVARSAWLEAKGLAEALAAGKKVEVNDANQILLDIMAGKRTLRVVAREHYEITTALRIAQEFGFRFVLEEAPEASRATKELAAAKIPVIFGPIRRASTSRPRNFGFGGASKAKERRRFDSARVLKDAGIPLALTAAGQTGEYGLARQAMFAMRYGLTRSEAVDAVTLAPAQLLGIADRVGTIAVGKDADLVLWNGEPFEATSRQQQVFINGRTVEGRVF